LRVSFLLPLSISIGCIRMTIVCLMNHCSHTRFITLGVTHDLRYHTPTHPAHLSNSLWFSTLSSVYNNDPCLIPRVQPSGQRLSRNTCQKSITVSSCPSCPFVIDPHHSVVYCLLVVYLCHMVPVLVLYMCPPFSPCPSSILPFPNPAHLVRSFTLLSSPT